MTDPLSDYDLPTGRIRPDAVRPRKLGVGQAASDARYFGFKPRWPDAKKLAALVVNGLLTLPQRYRRGSYMDILA